MYGAGGGSRTHTDFHPRDFKSRASTIPPHQLVANCVLARFQTCLKSIALSLVCYSSPKTAFLLFEEYRKCHGHPNIKSVLTHAFWRYHPDLNRGIKVLQTFALPLGYGAIIVSKACETV